MAPPDHTLHQLGHYGVKILYDLIVFDVGCRHMCYEKLSRTMTAGERTQTRI